MRYVVTRVHLFSPFQVHQRACGILPLQQNLSQQNIWSRRIRLQKQRTFQGLLRLRIVTGSAIGVPQPVIDTAIERIAHPLLLKLRNSYVQMFARECDFTEQGMSKRQLRVQFQRLRSELLSHRQIIPAQQHSRSQKISRRRLSRKSVLSRKRPPRLVILVCIEITKSEHIVRIDLGLRSPVSSGLEQRNRIRGPSHSK